MKRATCLLIFGLFIGVFSAAAQEDQCLEIWFIWSDDIRYEVNLDTGTVVSFMPPTPGSVNVSVPSGHHDSFDGRYTANLVEDDQRRNVYDLTVTDNEVGVAIPLARNVHEIDWSPDSEWLAYIQAEAESAPTL